MRTLLRAAPSLGRPGDPLYGELVLGLLLVAVAVGLSNFAAAIAIGLSGVDAKVRLRVGFIFGIFEAGMPVVGLAIGSQLAGSLGKTAEYVGGGLLIATGAYSLWQARRHDAEAPPPSSTRTLLLTGAALSIDNLVIGFALGAQDVSIALAAVVIGIVSVAMSLAGLELGDRLGRATERWSGEIGGGVLILVGIAIAAGILK